MAKVEEKEALPKEDLRDFFREMLQFAGLAKAANEGFPVDRSNRF